MQLLETALLKINLKLTPLDKIIPSKMEIKHSLKKLV